MSADASLIAKDAVINGIATLDRRWPEWRSDHINRAAIDQSSCGWCVLGQLFGSYDRGLEKLQLDYAEAADCGFDVHGDDEITYADLDDAWREALVKD